MSKGFDDLLKKVAECSKKTVAVAVAEDAEEFLAGLTSVTLPAYIEIADNWGMTMKIPFTVTVKVASE